MVKKGSVEKPGGGSRTPLDGLRNFFVRSDPMTCPLCDPALEPIIAMNTFWRLVLNRNQNLLGKCFLVLHRHAEQVIDLTGDEWADLSGQIKLATLALDNAFDPDHFNYAFLQNQDRHVHLHIIPRYQHARRFAGLVFADSAYPGHYAVDQLPRILDGDVLDQIADQIRLAYQKLQAI